MADYHNFVFDQEKRELVGDFDSMYKAEDDSGFDSWHQSDYRALERRIAMEMMQDFNFDELIDFGCGKGATTHRFKRHNNSVIGLDISQTAVERATQYYPDCDFEVMDFANLSAVDGFLKNALVSAGTSVGYCGDCLSYLSSWREFLALLSSHLDFIVITLFVPEDPIGHVKSKSQLTEEVKLHFDIVESIWMENHRHVVMLARSTKRK